MSVGGAGITGLQAGFADLQPPFHQFTLDGTGGGRGRMFSGCSASHKGLHSFRHTVEPNLSGQASVKPPKQSLLVTDVSHVSRLLHPVTSRFETAASQPANWQMQKSQREFDLVISAVTF